MEWLDYLKQWWFPYPATLRQLVEDDGDPLLHTALAKLKGAKIANSFTLLEAAAEAFGRDDLASRTGISEVRLLDLVHRADVSRLPYTSGGAVKRLWKMGYRSLADPQEYAVRIEAYFAAGGKGTAFDARKATIQGFLQDTRHAPEQAVNSPLITRTKPVLPGVGAGTTAPSASAARTAAGPCPPRAVAPARATATTWGSGRPADALGAMR